MLLYFILFIIFKGGINDMVAVYVALIIKGLRTYSSVPATIKDQVKEMLIELELEFLIDEWFCSKI